MEYAFILLFTYDPELLVEGDLGFRLSRRTPEEWNPPHSQQSLTPSLCVPLRTFARGFACESSCDFGDRTVERLHEEGGSLTRNHAIYNAGRKISVSTVATIKPPMIAKAIGPQNIVDAMGIKPRTVDMAVSMIGRKRDNVASMTAFQASLPSFRSASTCSMRITPLRAIMPVSERTPRMATNPSALSNRSSAPTTPIRPIGTTLRTRKTRLKLCNCIMSNVTMIRIVTGTTAKTEAWDCALSSTTPPNAM